MSTVITMRKLVKEMSQTSNELVTAEKRFDTMKSCKELSKDDMHSINDLMLRANKLTKKFRESTTEQTKKDSTEYGMLMARMLCTEKSFADLMNIRCPKPEFNKLVSVARKEFDIPDDE